MEQFHQKLANAFKEVKYIFNDKKIKYQVRQIVSQLFQIIIHPQQLVVLSPCRISSFFNFSITFLRSNNNQISTVKLETLFKNRKLLSKSIRRATQEWANLQRQYYYKYQIIIYHSSSWRRKVISSAVKASRTSKRIKVQIMINAILNLNGFSKQRAFTKSFPIIYIPQIAITNRHRLLLGWCCKICHELKAHSLLLHSSLKELTPKVQLNYHIILRLKFIKQEAAQKKKKLAVINIIIQITKINLRKLNQAFNEIKPEPTPQEARDALGLLVLMISKKHRLKFLNEKFSLWRRNARFITLRFRKIMDKLDRLGSMYDMQNTLLNKKKLREVKLSIQDLYQAYFIWKQLLNDDRLRKKFFNVLLRTTFGKLSKCYLKWSNLPDLSLKENQKKGMLMITNLQNKTFANFRLAFRAFKEINDIAKNKKTMVIKELIETTMNKSYQAFYKWANYTRYARLTEQNLKRIRTIKMAIQITQIKYRDKLLRLVTISKKYENASDLYKVLHNIELRILREDWNKLKNHAIQKKMEDDLNNVNKKEIINRMQSAFFNSNHGRLILVLKRFDQNRKNLNNIKKIFKYLLNSSYGQAMVGFQKWKTIPENSDKENLKRASKFERNLNLFYRSRLQKAMIPFKDLNLEGQAKEKWAILKMMRVCQSGTKRLFFFWANFTKIQKEIVKCKRTLCLLESLSTVAHNNLNLMLDRQSDKQIKVLERLIAASMNKMRQAFFKWVNFKNIKNMQEKLTNDKKQIILAWLNQRHSHSRNGMLKLILNAFHANGRIGRVTKTIMGRLHQTKFGGVMISFNTWKNLPERKEGDEYKAGSKFLMKLQIFFKRNLKMYLFSTQNQYI